MQQGIFIYAGSARRAFIPAEAARIFALNKPVGWIGELHPELVRTLDLTYAPVMFELEMDSSM